ncbi:MAG TPA: serine/threonine-protein kinase [Polyangiales bacterium]|nr:serine/threonine-protein kinase [Polyangiales bacterium]
MTTANDPWLGRVLAGRYRILQKAADGQRGVLYRAERSDDGRRVALKLVEPQFHQSQQHFEARLMHEIEVARGLTDRNTIAIYEGGHADDRLMFVAAEWLSGIDLARMLAARGPLNTRQALFLANQVARSLANAHQRKIWHGDLSPEGLFVTRDSRGLSLVKVMDYGRLRIAHYSDEGFSQVNMPIGWARYLAPEQITNDEFDGRADLYALGSILYRALSGELPFKDATGIGILMSQVNDHPAPLRSHASAKDVPDAVEQVVMRCLEKDPAKRYATADELIELTERLAR